MSINFIVLHLPLRFQSWVCPPNKTTKNPQCIFADFAMQGLVIIIVFFWQYFYSTSKFPPQIIEQSMFLLLSGAGLVWKAKSVFVLSKYASVVPTKYHFLVSSLHRWARGEGENTPWTSKKVLLPPPTTYLQLFPPLSGWPPEAVKK